MKKTSRNWPRTLLDLQCVQKYTNRSTRGGPCLLCSIRQTPAILLRTSTTPTCSAPPTTPPNASNGSGRIAFPLARSRCSLVTPATARASSPSISPPASPAAQPGQRKQSAAQLGPIKQVESQETSAGSQQMPSGSGLSALDSRLPGSVLILSAEDDLRDTIRPRLDAAGADPSRIFVLPSVTDLRNDLAKLRAAIDRAPNCRLLIIDPLNAYVGPSDSHFHTVVRRVFQPLAQLAAEKGLAVLAVSHLRKQTGAAIQRTTGSMGFVAVARAVWTVCRDAVQTDRHLLLPLKNNLVANTDGLAYTITSANPASPAGSESA